MREPTWFKWVRAIGLILLALFALIPVWVMVTSALKPLADVHDRFTWFPSHLSTKPFVEMWKTIPLADYFVNSVVVSTVASIASVVVALFAAYALSRYRFRGRQAFSVIVLSTQMFPGILFLLPLLRHLRQPREHNRHPALRQPDGPDRHLHDVHAAVAIWMLAGYLDSVPRDLDEAAKVDGCGPLGAFVRVVIPAARPGIIAVLIYAFMTAWGEVLFASVLTDDSTRTLAVGLQGYANQNNVYWNQIMAAALTMACRSSSASSCSSVPRRRYDPRLREVEGSRSMNLSSLPADFRWGVAASAYRRRGRWPWTGGCRRSRTTSAVPPTRSTGATPARRPATRTGAGRRISRCSAGSA